MRICGGLYMRLLAKGNTAEILEQDEKLVCKLFNSGYPKIYIEHEFDKVTWSIERRFVATE